MWMVFAAPLTGRVLRRVPEGVFSVETTHNFDPSMVVLPQSEVSQKVSRHNKFSVVCGRHDQQDANTSTGNIHVTDQRTRR